MAGFKIIHDFWEKDSYENDNVFNDNSLIVAYFNSFENSVGTDFYYKLHEIFSAYGEFVDLNENYQTYMKKSNKILNEYTDLQREVNATVKKYSAPLNKYIQPLFDIKYNAEFDEKSNEMKQDFDEIFDGVINLNSLMKKSEECDEKILTSKEKLLADSRKIRQLYSELKNMGSLNFFKKSCKMNVKKDFFNNVEVLQLGEMNFDAMFDYLWALSDKEVRALISIANHVMTVVNSMKVGTEKMSKATMNKNSELFDEYHHPYNILVEITDSGLKEMFEKKN